MKNQYFGDINDYRKYGLLRLLIQATGLQLGVCWLLTADDDRPDGEFRSYLYEPDRWGHHDPELYASLQRLRDSSVGRSVRHAPAWELLPGSRYYDALLEDPLPARQAYFRNAWDSLAGCQLLFFDPDNGLEVQSVPRGRRNSAKYLYWREVEQAYGRGHSLVVYQHFPRQERTSFTTGLGAEATARLPGVVVDSFSTPHVLFLLFGHPAHGQGFRRAHDLIVEKWQGQIRPMAHGTF
jgi:hypothetical protein